MSKLVMRSAYDFDTVGKYGTDCVATKESPSLTIQDEAKHCDINNIMARYENARVSPFVEPDPSLFFDATAVSDYHSALNAVQHADALFMMQPAHIRSRFENDAGNFVQFMSDPGNLEEAVQLGLVTIKDPLPGKLQDAARAEGPKARGRASMASGKAPKGRAAEGEGPEDEAGD